MTRAAAIPMMQTEMFPSVKFTDPERAVFRKRERLTVSEWAEKHIVVTTGPHPGPWRNSYTPYLKEIMDTWDLPWVRKVVVCATPQSGKTAAMYNCLAKAADQNPSADLVVMPNEVMAKRVSKRRIRPMFDQSPRLNSLKTSNPDDFATLGITLINGHFIDLAWARSPSALASMPIERIFLDEVDKYPPFVGDETDPVTLAELRTRTFRWTSKIFMVSTPTVESGFIWQGLKDCIEVRDYYAACVFCGGLQKMVFKQIKWPGDIRDPKRIRGERLAWYECEHCGKHWDDGTRDKAVLAGGWQAREARERPYSVGFHLPAFPSPFVSLSESAAVFLESKGSKAKMRDFANSHEAEPWKDWAVDRAEDAVLALRDDRPRGLVPTDIACLTAGIDTQDIGVYYEIRAWAWGGTSESRLIREGWVETWADLEKVLFHSSYKDADGREYPVQFSLIDSAGHRTVEVYDFCRKHRNVLPLIGRQRMAKPWSVTNLDSYPDGRKMQGGLKLYNINTTHYKDYLARLLEISPADPGAWHLHSEVSQDYAAQICAEYRDDHGIWQCPKHKANHYWDCGVYNLAVQDILQVRFWQKPEGEAAGPGRRVRSKGVE